MKVFQVLILLIFISTALSAQNVGIGTIIPTEKLEVIGKIKTQTFRMTNGAVNNYILQSDATGNATWVPLPSPTSSYAYIYNTSGQLVFIESDVTFDTNGSLSGISHTPGTSSITFTNSGVYKVNFSISGSEPNQFALFLNGIEVTGSIYGSGSGGQQNNGQALVTISPGDILTLRNHTSFSDVTLGSTGGTAFNVNASVLIEKI